MQRVTVTLDDELMGLLDEVMQMRGYRTRSEALRDLARLGLARSRAANAPEMPCMGVAVYTYDHHNKEVARKVTSAHHSSHALQVSSLHIHLDQRSCMEISVMRGRVGEVRHFADHLLSERHICYGDLVILPQALPQRG